MNTQRGSALILSLLILLVMTMLGITAMSTSTLQERMAANDRNQKVAFQNSELTLTQTEADARDMDFMTDLRGVVGSSSHIYAEDAVVDYHDPATWGNADCGVAIELNTVDGSSSNGCRLIHIVEQTTALEAGGGYGQLDQSNLTTARLRLTALGTDGSGKAQAKVQSTFDKVITP